MTYQTILTRLVDGSIGLITLSRPECANALSQQMAEELVAALHVAEQTPAIRVIILTGSGEKAFCAGADLKERSGMNKNQWHVQHEAFEKAIATLLASKKPIIAAMNGAAFGGGLELALACDFIYAADNTRMGLPEAKLGIMPGMGGTQFLSRAIGTRRAKEALFLGETITAEEALQLGLVNHICPLQDLLSEVVAVALAIADNAPLSITAIKHAVDEGAAQSLDVALRTELRHYNGLLDTKDRSEGINAWSEKRKAQFTGN